MVNTASTFSLWNNVPMDRIIRAEESDGRMKSLFRASFEPVCSYSVERTQLPLTGESGWGGQVECVLNDHDLDMIGSCYLHQFMPGIRHRKNPRRLKPNEQPEGGDYASLGHSAPLGPGMAAGMGPMGPSGPLGHGMGSAGPMAPGLFGRDEYEDIPEESYSYSDSYRGCGPVKDKKLPQDYAMYTMGLGHVNVLCCEFHLDSKKMIPQDTHYMDIFDEITGNASHNTEELIGTYNNMYDLWKASREPQQRVWKCDFFFNKHLSHALPIFCIAKSRVSIVFKLRNLNECYLTSDGSVPYVIDEDRPLATSDLKLKFIAKTYYLHDRERFDMFTSPHEFLISNVKCITQKVKSSDSHSSDAPAEEIPLDVHGAIIEVVFVVQRTEHIRNKDFLNYSGRGGKDPITEVSLVYRGMELLKPSTPQELRLITTREHHSSTPLRHIYTYSFSNKPERALKQPKGHCSVVKGDTPKLRIKLQPGLGEAIVRVYVIKYDLFQIKANGEVDIPTLG